MAIFGIAVVGRVPVASTSSVTYGMSASMPNTEFHQNIDEPRRGYERWLQRAFPGIDTQLFGWVTSASVLLVGYYVASTRFPPPAWLVTAIGAASGWSRAVSRSFAVFTWMHLLAVLLLLLLPMVSLNWMKGIGPTEVGFRLRGTRREFLLVVGLYLLFLPIIYYFSRTLSFQLTYPRLRAARDSAEIFAVFQLMYLFKWIAWEFFFRGFMLFGLERKLGANAVLVSTLAFALMHIPKPTAELIGAIPAGYLLCWLAKRGRSILPGVLLHWAVAGSMELFACRFWR